MWRSIIEVNTLSGANPDALSLLGITGWLGPIQVSSTASDETIEAAEELAAVMSLMGPTISVVEGRTGPGILVGTVDEWSPLFGQVGGTAPAYFDGSTDYVIVTRDGYVKIIGKDQAGVLLGIWRFAHLIGYRMLATTDEWQITPSVLLGRVKIAVAEDRPLTFVFGIGAAGGINPDEVERLDTWNRRNNLSTPYRYGYGHTWGAIRIANQAEFTAHPEYMGSVNKFCVFEPGLQAICIDYAKDRCIADPTIKVTSMAAADGTNGWSTPCTGTGEHLTSTPSDRQIALANVVQAALDDDPACNGARVAIQAYGDMSRKPTLELNPRVLVVVADGFILDGRTYEQVVADYQAVGAVDLVPYKYLSVWTWHRGAPGKSRASSMDTVAEDAELAFASPGSLKAYATEGGSSWGPDGLGYWVLGQLLSGFGTDAEQLRLDYISMAMGSAAAEMMVYYDLISENLPLTTDLVHRLYQACLDGLSATTDPAVKERIRHLIVYVRYLELYRLFETEPSLSTYEPVMQHMYRARHLDLMAYRFAYFDPGWTTYLAQLSAKYGYSITVFTAKPWPDDLFTASEIESFARDGLGANPLLPFDPVSYSDELELVPRPNDGRARGTYVYATHNHSWYLKMVDGQTTFNFTTKGGISVNTPGKLLFFDTATDEQVAEIDIAADGSGVTHNETLELEENKLYRVDVIAGGGAEFRAPGYALTRLSNLSAGPFAADFSGYFLVPAGTTLIGGYSQADDVRFKNPAGVTVFTPGVKKAYFSFQISPPATDEIWRVENANGSLGLMTVPPGIALHPNELLTPIGL